MPKIPAARPVFADAETNNGIVDSASLKRKIVDYLNWSFYRDVGYTPSDGKHAPSDYWPSLPTLARRIRVTASPSFSAFVVVTAHLTPVAGQTARLYVKNMVTGELHTADASAPNVAEWVTVEVPFSGEGELAAYTLSANAAVTPWAAVCAWWKPLPGQRAGVTIDSSWETMTQAFAAAQRPDSSHVLKWLARKANLFASFQSQMLAVCWNEQAGSSSDGIIFAPGGLPKTLRFKVYESKLIPTHYFRTFWYKTGGTTTMTMTVKRDGTTVYSTTVNSGGVYGSSWTPSSPGGVHEYTVELTVAASGTATDFVLQCLSLAEDGDAALGGSWPSSFPVLERDLLAVRSPIRAGLDAAGREIGLSGLIGGMLWLWRNRLPRQLVCASIPHPDFRVAYPIGGDSTIHRRFYYKPGPDAAETPRYLRARIFQKGWYDGRDNPLKLVLHVNGSVSGDAVNPIPLYPYPTEVGPLDAKGLNVGSVSTWAWFDLVQTVAGTYQPDAYDFQILEKGREESGTVIS